MNDNLQNALALLASKLGTTVEHLWPLLVRREYLLSWVTLIGVGSIGFGFVALCAYFTFLSVARDGEEGSWIMLILSGLAALLFISIAASQIPDILVPEAAAIETLIGAAKR